MFKPHDPNTLGDMISRLWVFTLFTMVFRDIHEMATASTIQGILEGTYEGNPVTEAGLFFGGVALVILLLTSLLSVLLKPYAARRLNLAIAPIALGGIFYLVPNDPDDYLLGGASAIAVMTIFITSWFWKTTAKIDSMREVRHAA